MIFRQPDERPGVSRRTLLAAAATGVAGAGLVAGCSPSTGPSARASGTGRSSAAASPSSSSSSAPTTLSELAARLTGRLDLPGSAGYQPADLLWNPRFSAAARPAAIARCASAADVAACVAYAAASGRPMTVRNGGHSYSGASTGDGLVVDLSTSGRMSGVQVDPSRGTAEVGAGAVLVDVYSALAAAGASMGAGSCPSVGMSGLTLGGGVGVLARGYGTAADQVRAVQAVDAHGRVREVSADSSDSADRDLFWAVRGGGAGTAVVTSWTVAAAPAPRVWTVSITWPWSAAQEVAQAWQAWAAGCPRELWSGLRLECQQGSYRVVLIATWTGTAGAAALDRLLQPLTGAVPAATSRSAQQRSYGEAMLYEAVCSGKSAQQCFQDAWTPAQRAPFAATSSIVGSALPEAGIAAARQAVEQTAAVSGVVNTAMAFDVLGGAVGDVAVDATPFPWRQALATVQHTATWSTTRAGADPGPYDRAVAAQRAALRPWCGDGAYLNYADAQLTDRLDACLQGNAARLRSVQAAQDPDGLLRSGATA